MRSEDLMSKDNNRQDAIDKLIAFCTAHDLSYNYTEHVFTIPLPGAEPLPTATHLTPLAKKRKKFSIDNWGPKGVDETNLPDPEKPLNEGETPPETL